MNAVPERLPVVLAAMTVVLQACQPGGDTAQIVGQLESDRVELIAEFAEPVLERPAVEGRAVTAGDVLMILDDRRAQARLKELTAALEQQKARLAELTRGPREEQIAAERANADGARQELKFRDTDFRRVQDVVEKNLAAPEALDRARAALDAARSAVGVSEARLAEMLAGTTVEELRQVENAVAQAEARVESARIDVERHRITAPVDGLVDSLLIEVGERPLPQSPVIVLLTGDQPYVRAYVPAALRARISVGDAAKVYVEGLTQPQDARLRWVASDAAYTPYFALTERDRGHLTYLAKFDLLASEQASRWPDGVPVELELPDVSGP